MKKNLALEKDLMKNVPGWKAGTWYGEPIYFTLGDNWIEPIALVCFYFNLRQNIHLKFKEANAHLDYYDWDKNSYWRQEGPWPNRF